MPGYMLPLQTSVCNCCRSASGISRNAVSITLSLTALRPGSGSTAFGPVVSIVRRKNLDEVIELVNTRNYANASCIYTSSGPTAREFKYRVTPSMVGINIGIAAPMSFFPFGGAGNSMFGDTKGHGQEIFNFFTDTKVVIQRWF